MRARASDRVHRMFTLAANRTAVKADRRRTAIPVTEPVKKSLRLARERRRPAGAPGETGAAVVRSAPGPYAFVSFAAGASSAVRTARAQ